MSLPELIPSNLPVFTRKTPRSNFANSVVPQGSALLFAQSDSNGGVRFVTKNPDGSYTDVGGGGTVEQPVPGYFVNTNGVLTFHSLSSDSLSQSVSSIKIIDTGVDEPAYQGGSGGGSSMNFYKCTIPVYLTDTVSPENATSNQGTGYTISASSIYNNNYDAWKAFSGASVSYNSRWFSESGNSGEQWIKIQFAVAKIVNSYTMSIAYDDNWQYISQWKMQGSNDNSTWVDLDHRSNQSLQPEYNETFQADFDNSTAYLYYRIYLPSTFGYDYIGLQAIKLIYKAKSETWTGKLASIDEITGMWSFASNSTSGLSYDILVPQKNSVYAYNGSVCVYKVDEYNYGMPVDGLIRKLTLNSMSTTDQATPSASYSYSDTQIVSDSGVSVLNVTSSGGGVVANSRTPALKALTFSAYIKKLPEASYAAWLTYTGYAYGNEGNEVQIWYYKDENNKYFISFSDGSADYTMGVFEVSEGWHHIALVWTDDAYRMYIDGIKRGSDVTKRTYQFSSGVYIGINKCKRFGSNALGQYAMVKMYDRALSSYEIYELAHQLPLIPES